MAETQRQLEEHCGPAHTPGGFFCFACSPLGYDASYTQTLLYTDKGISEILKIWKEFKKARRDLGRRIERQQVKTGSWDGVWEGWKYKEGHLLRRFNSQQGEPCPTWPGARNSRERGEIRGRMT